MLLEGQRLNRYHILKWIGGGGMGQVYHAKDTHKLTDKEVPIRDVAIKVITLPNDPNQAELAIELFMREVQAIAANDHPQILPLFDYGIQPGDGTKLAYIIMPLCQEGSLADWRQKRILSPQDVAHFLRQASGALHYAHNQNIVHKDVKLQNFLIKNNTSNPHLPDLLLTDFGIAKLSIATMSLGNLVIGTPAYMPPEQWEGKPEPATDQYALAVMAYQLLTNRFPFQSDNQKEMQDLDWMKKQHKNTIPELPSKHNPNISRKLDNVILHALAKNPKDRFTSISAFTQAFQQAVDDMQNNGDIRVTLWLDAAEAATGCTRTLTLLGGRQVNISIPAGVYNGQIGRLDGFGEIPPSGGPRGALIITIAIKPSKSILAILEKYFSTIKNLLSTSKGVARILSALNNINLNPITKPLLIRRGIAVLLISLVIIIIASSLIYSNIASRNPYPPYTGTLTLNDPMSDNGLQNKWDDATIAGLGTCGFEQGKYELIPLQNHELSCYPENVSYYNLVNFVFEVQMTFIKGDRGGIVFRFNQNNGTGYGFFIGEDRSYYILNIYSKDNKKILNSTNSFDQSINTDLGQSILIAVVANDSQLDFYVDHKRVYSTTDRTWSQGQIGVNAYSKNNPTEVAFSNAKMWTL